MLLVEKENRRKLVKLVLNRLSFISSVHPTGFKIFALLNLTQPRLRNIHKTGIWQSTICNNIQSNPSQQGKTFEQTG